MLVIEMHNVIPPQTRTEEYFLGILLYHIHVFKSFCKKYFSSVGNFHLFILTFVRIEQLQPHTIKEKDLKHYITMELLEKEN